jgi:AcrR family transcriptional regulator
MSLAGRTKRQVLAEFRNAEILNAARRVFAARGFEGACVEDIAHVAGVAKGTVYLYYASKDALYRAALKRGLAEMCASIRRRVECAPSVREKLRAFVETKLAHFEEHRDFFRIYSSAFARTPGPLFCHRDLRVFQEEQLSILESALAAGGSARGVRPQTAARAVFDVTRGLIERRLCGESREATEKEAAALLDLVWKGFARR